MQDPLKGEVVEAEKGRRPVSQVCGQERWGENEIVEEFRICWHNPRFEEAQVSAILSLCCANYLSVVVLLKLCKIKSSQHPLFSAKTNFTTKQIELKELQIL